MSAHEWLILLPAYNEGHTIGTLLDGMKASGVTDMADIVVLNDCSEDATAEIARQRGIHCLNAPIHLGYAAILRLGYSYARLHGYEALLQMDADGQHDVCNIPRMFAALSEPDGENAPPDLVIGSRFLPGSASFPIARRKRWAINLFSLLIDRMTGQRFTDPTSGLQAMNAAVFRYYADCDCFDASYPDANAMIQTLMHGYRVAEIPAIMHGRKDGKSMYAGLFKQATYIPLMLLSIAAVTLRQGQRHR